MHHILKTFTSALDGNFASIAFFGIVAIVLAQLVPYLVDKHGIRSYPGPWLAKLSKLWLARAALRGRTGADVHDLHEKYGTFVRVAPDQISIADPDAMQMIYSFASGTTKSNLYSAFASFRSARSVFNTQSRVDHTRKRKIFSHVMSTKSLAEFEPVFYQYDRMLMKKWDDLCAAGAKGIAGSMGDCVWEARNGRAWFDCMPWLNYVAFDIIGDLAFGAPFGMLKAVRDAAPVAVSQEEALASYTSSDATTALKHILVPAIKTVNEASAFNTFLGCLPVWLRPLAMSIPSFKQSLKSRKALATMAITAVSKRISNEKELLRRDFLTKLLEGRDGEGKPLGAAELSSEAVSLLVAGSDTTSNSAAAIAFYLAQNPTIQAKLQAELDVALGPPDLSLSVEDSVSEACLQKVMHCQFLQDVINEGLRLHSTVSFGLPRVVPEGGITVLGRSFSAGTILSTPILTVHRLKSVWGNDADVFNPERWATGDKAAMHKAFAPFSVGPRACLGRNFAQIELTILISSIFHRYDLILGSPDQQLEVHEGFLRKPLAVPVGLKLRTVPAA